MHKNGKETRRTMKKQEEKKEEEKKNIAEAGEEGYWEALRSYEFLTIIISRGIFIIRSEISIEQN